LALSKLRGLGPVRIDPREPFTVFVKDGDLPMPMLAAPIFAQFCAFSLFQGLDLPIRGKYLNCDEQAQVPVPTLVVEESKEPAINSQIC